MTFAGKRRKDFTPGVQSREKDRTSQKLLQSWLRWS